ncbi:MAG: flagellar basal body P-ring formation chaperone FlgA [Planctomycetota bacterium]|nr:flagellar basal body P-ring formation chaperone FlgA [Planctomycetota bacterium]
MNNQRPLSKRKTVQLMVILTILAWATQTLFHQWGFGDEVPADASATPAASAPQPTPDSIGAEKFVSGSSSIGGTLELRGEATVLGAEVKLKQICRWSDADAAVFSTLGDLTILRMSPGSPFRSINISDIKQSLQDAGVNVAMINFAGPAGCTITRSDATADEHEALKQWIDEQQKSAGQISEVPATQPAPMLVAQTTAVTEEKSVVQSLRAILTADVAQRLGIPLETIQMIFNAEDEKILSLSQPLFKFDITPTRLSNLGNVSWDVAIVTGAETKKVSLTATARAWVTQVTVLKPLAFRQVLEASDFTEQRVLVDLMPDQTLLSRDQCVGQQASADLKPGMIMTARLVDPVPLVQPGQLVTITLTQGTVQIKAVGVAMEQGAMGQTIKVRNEVTRDVFDATVTGPQEARLGNAAVGGVASTTGG